MPRELICIYAPVCNLSATPHSHSRFRLACQSPGTFNTSAARVCSDRRQATGLHGTSAFPHEGSAGSLTGGASLTRRTGSVSPTRSVAASPTQSWHAGVLLIRLELNGAPEHAQLLFQGFLSSLVELLRQLFLHGRGVNLDHIVTILHRVWHSQERFARVRRQRRHDPTQFCSRGAAEVEAHLCAGRQRCVGGHERGVGGAMLPRIRPSRLMWDFCICADQVPPSCYRPGQNVVGMRICVNE